MIGVDAVLGALQAVTDPEYPVSIVDLGMVYRVAVEETAVSLDVSFTSIGCPAMEDIVDDIRTAVQALPGVATVQVSIVWSPPWTRARITERGRQLLACCGVAA